MHFKMNYWNKKRVFISGGAGVIGTALVNILMDYGAELFVGDLKEQPKEWQGKLLYRKGDLITLTPMEIKEFSPEIYFHLAATFERSEETYEFLQENFHHNIALSHKLMSLMKDMPELKKIVFASSYLIYDPQCYLFSEPKLSSVALKETAAINPRNLCGMAKLLHEKELFFIQKFHPHLQIICPRIFRSYGKNSRDIISRWVQNGLRNEPITVFCPEGRFDYVFAEDVAGALIRLAETQFNGVVNVGSGRTRSIADVTKIMKTVFPKLSISYQHSDIPCEASQADMQLFHSVIPPFTFRNLEETIPELTKFYDVRDHGYTSI